MSRTRHADQLQGRRGHIEEAGVDKTNSEGPKRRSHRNVPGADRKTICRIGDKIRLQVDKAKAIDTDVPVIAHLTNLKYKVVRRLRRTSGRPLITCSYGPRFPRLSRLGACRRMW